LHQDPSTIHKSLKYVPDKLSLLHFYIRNPAGEAKLIFRPSASLERRRPRPPLSSSPPRDARSPASGRKIRRHGPSCRGRSAVRDCSCPTLSRAQAAGETPHRARASRRRRRAARHRGLLCRYGHDCSPSLPACPSLLACSSSVFKRDKSRVGQLRPSEPASSPNIPLPGSLHPLLLPSKHFKRRSDPFGLDLFLQPNTWLGSFCRQHFPAFLREAVYQISNM
jgi:hypothetical protein